MIKRSKSFGTYEFGIFITFVFNIIYLIVSLYDLALNNVCAFTLTHKVP